MGFAVTIIIMISILGFCGFLAIPIIYYCKRHRIACFASTATLTHPNAQNEHPVSNTVPYQPTVVGHPVPSQQYQTTAAVHSAPSQQYYPATAYNPPPNQPYQAPSVAMPQPHQPYPHTAATNPPPNEGYQPTPAFNPAYPPAANTQATYQQPPYYPPPQGFTYENSTYVAGSVQQPPPQYAEVVRSGAPPQETSTYPQKY